MPSPFTLTGTEEEFKKMFPNLKFGEGWNGVTTTSTAQSPQEPVISKPRNRRTIKKKVKLILPPIKVR